MSSEPPVVAAWMMRRSLQRGDRDAVMGDLLEEFRARASLAGVAAAKHWYRRQVVRSLLYNIGQRLTWFRIDGSGQDFRHALRSLRATPTVTVVALVVLTLGIGATTAIFSVVDGVVLRGLPYWRGDRLVVLSEPSTSPHVFQGASVAAADFEDWRTRQHSFEDLAAVQGSPYTFTSHDSEGAHSLRVQMASASLFTLLRVRPALGRLLTRDDEIRRERVAVLSDGCWRRLFGGDPYVVGQTLAADNGAWTIVGVAAPSFRFPAAATKPADVWIPYVPVASELSRGDGTHRSSHAEVLGRLRDGVSLAEGRADVERITAVLVRENPRFFRNRWVAVTSLQESIVGPVKSWMLLLLGAVGFVLLIACVNVANLLLARATARSRDVAVRSALGASRWRLLRGLLAESLLLSLTGTALGVAFAVWSVEILRAALPPSLPRLDEVGINDRVLLAAAVSAVLVAIGVTPVWQSSPSTLVGALREAGRSGTAGASRRRLRLGLLTAEIALAIVLLIGSGLFMSSFVRLMRVDLGFDIRNVLSVDLTPHERAKGKDGAFLPRFAERMQAAFEQARRVPGVEKAALVSGTPPLVSGNDRTSIIVPGQPPFGGDDSPDDKNITPDYFAVFRVPLVAGRSFTDEDAAPGAPRVVILNDVAAARYFGTANPIGVDIQISQAKNTTFTIVGVVRSVRLRGPETDVRPEIYRPLDWRLSLGSPDVALVARTVPEPGRLAPVLMSAIRSAAPDMVIPPPETYEGLFAAVVARQRFNTYVLGLFGLLAITIAGAGIYGVMAYLVEQRTREIGVRLALGADPAALVRMVLGQASGCLLIGLTIGLAAGWMLSRFTRAFLFRVDVHDPAVYIAAATVLVLAGLAAASIPARRASRVDPIIALRAQ